MKISNFFAGSILTLISCLSAFAQSGTNAGSPYSQFGYGLLNDNATASQRQMGSIGYAMNSGRQINVKNPASYAFIDSLTFLFDMGIDFTIRNSKQEATADNTQSSEHKLGGGLDYVTLQFPIAKRFGMSVGMLPYSSVGYSFGTKIANGVNAREGSGGLNQLYLGFAGKIINNLSVGFNFSYLFGNVINDIYATPSNTSQSLFEELTQVRDFHVELGAQYKLKINPNHALTLGVVYSPGKTLLGEAVVTAYDMNADKEPEERQRVKLRGNASLPATYGAGINYMFQNRLMVEADFTYQPWKNVKMVNLDGFQPNRFDNRYAINLGAQFTPNTARGNYLQRIAYRIGALYNRDYVMIGNNHVKEYGITCGFGLPTLSSKTILNLGFDFRHRQGSPQALIKENYFNIRLGINFNELWFFQNKLN